MANAGLPGGASGVCDTPSTPVPHDTVLWTQVAGATTRDHGKVPATSPTRATDDLFATAFRNQTNGWAGGAACEKPSDPIETCARHPVMYRYSDADGHGPQWRLDTAFPGSGPGFVGAISYIPHTDRFLAVGGSGSYPRREPAAGSPDPAGAARAWLYSNGVWRELTPDLPSGMRGMAALDFTPTPAPLGEYGVGGALGQLWLWQNGHFLPDKIDANSSQLHATVLDPNNGSTLATNAAPADFRFRVREIRAQVDPSGQRVTFGRFLAATAGCCDSNPANNHLVYLSDDSTQWTVSKQHADPRSSDVSTDPRLVSAYALTSGVSNDSQHVVTASPSTVLLNADGPEGMAEPPSGIQNAWNNSSDYSLTGGARLVSGDGLLAHDRYIRTKANEGDPRFDWYVGVDRSTGHGLAYGSGLTQPSNGVDTSKAAAGQPPTVDQSQAKRSQQSYKLLDLGSFGLNAFREVGETSGVGWAVGDRGAIVQLGESGPQVGVEPRPPLVGASAAGSFTITAPYDAFRPLVTGAASGGVPALMSRPLQTMPQPGPLAAGSPDPAGGPFVDVTQVVMSADGSEGWAVGGTHGLALYHYDGTSWARCDPIGAPPLIRASPHCAGLADLAGRDLRLSSAALVPHGGGADASAKNDFEVVAVGDFQSASAVRRRAIVRYRDGAWHPESPDTMKAIAKSVDAGVEYTGALTSVAFGAPDDGWAVGTTADSRAVVVPIFHFDGTRWIDCAAAAVSGEYTRCGDQGRRLPQIYANSPVKPGALRVLAVGRRVYLSGARAVLAANQTSVRTSFAYPLILHREPGGQWTAADGGYDPGIDQAQGGSETVPVGPHNVPQGEVDSLAVARGPDGRYQGWAVGFYSSTPVGGVGDSGSSAPIGPLVADARLLRLEAGGVGWTEWRTVDAANDYLSGMGGENAIVSEPGSSLGSAVLATDGSPLLGFDDATQRWRVVAGPVSPSAAEPQVTGQIQALTGDRRGGFWMAAGGSDPVNGPGAWFYRYSDRAPAPVFSDVSHPLSRTVTALAGAAGGTVWAGTDSDQLARYDRLTGWDIQRIPGWNPGLVTAPSPVNAIALAADGTGVAVGAGGRIADLGTAVKLDSAAGAGACSVPPAAPVCGTGRDLRAAAVAPDGSALVGGDALALLWRRARGEFQAITKPLAASAARITGISMPALDRAWLSVSTGQVFAGHLSGSDWSWQLENVDAQTGDLLSNDGAGRALRLRAVAVDASGRGFAVGDKGLVLERGASGAHPWRRLETGFQDDLTSVTLPASPGPGVLIGGANGLVLTLVAGRFEVARQADLFADGKAVVGLALLPGVASGHTEAWAALSDQTSGSSLLHYASDPYDVLLNPDGRVRALPDTPLARAGEVSVAALGKSDCHLSANDLCDSVTGLALANDIGARRDVQAIAAASKLPGGPRFAVFTGDVNDSAGRVEDAQARGASEDAGQKVPVSGSIPSPNVSRWSELIASGLRAAGVPVYGAIGAQDVTSERQCFPNAGCFGQKQVGGQGACGAGQCVSSSGNSSSNLLWREALAGQPAPWGHGHVSRSRTLSFDPVPDQSGSSSSPLGGARTHYALDVSDGDHKLVRLVFVDNSQRSLAAGDPIQQPQEAGGQQAWLQQVLCTGTPGCTRASGEQAIVVASTPTWSFGPGAVTGVATDAASFESTLMANHASLVVSGRLGWNARYWAIAPGVHCPGVGANYTDEPPDPARPASCAQGTAGAPSAAKAPQPPAAVGQLADTLQGLGAPPPPDPTGTVQSTTGAGLLPFVIASGAGGKLASSTGEGEWHGYTIARLDRSGDSAKTIVEQRPVFDWLNISAKERTLLPGQHVTLIGVGREPLSVNEPAQLDRINSPAITHRYDLLQADSQRPYLPRVGADGGYVELDPSVATVDRESGKVTTGRGNHSRVYAIALLSAGGQTATYPMVFEPRRSYSPLPPAVIATPAPPVVPQVHVAAIAASTPAPPPPAPPPAPPIVGTPGLPLLPGLPGLPPLSTPPPAAPPPPAGAPPPAPPASHAPSALSLSISPESVGFAPPSGLVPPPAPPINPAPPGGARREAKAKQPAAAKSEETTATGASPEDTHGNPDLVTRDIGVPGEHMSALDRPHHFTALRMTGQPSAWSRDAVWGIGLSLASLLLAGVYSYSGPRRGRRTSVVASPAWSDHTEHHYDQRI
jgi:hypothetical protein